MLTMMMLNEDFVNLPAFHLLVRLLVHLLVHLTFYFPQSLSVITSLNFSLSNSFATYRVFVCLPHCFHTTVMLALFHQTFLASIRAIKLVYQFEP